MQRQTNKKTWRQGLNLGHRGQRRNVQRSLKGLLFDVQLRHMVPQCSFLHEEVLTHVNPTATLQ